MIDSSSSWFIYLFYLFIYFVLFCVISRIPFTRPSPPRRFSDNLTNLQINIFTNHMSERWNPNIDLKKVKDHTLFIWGDIQYPYYRHTIPILDTPFPLARYRFKRASKKVTILFVESTHFVSWTKFGFIVLNLWNHLLSMRDVHQVYKNLQFHLIMFNPFHATGLFLCPLKIENQRFLMFSGGIGRDQWHEMG